MKRLRYGNLSALAGLVIMTTPGMAQEDSDPAQADIAMQLSNPVADLVSVPFQFNFASGVGPDDGTRTILNVQPVVPFTLNDDWNLIGRWIMPFVSQPSLGPGLESSYGMSDIIFSAFFSPRNSNGIIWGVGPVLSLPVTTDPVLGSGKWAAGPTFVALKQNGPWTYGALVNYLWSFSDATDEPRSDVSVGFMQPFLSYATPDGVTYSVNLEASFNAEGSSGNKRTIPMNFNISKVTRFGPFPFSVGGGLGWYVDAPDGAPDWQLRASFALILPRGQ